MDTDKNNNNMFLGLELAELQKAKEDLSCLPTLRIDDIDRQLQSVATTTVISAGTRLSLFYLQ